MLIGLGLLYSILHLDHLICSLILLITFMHLSDQTVRLRHRVLNLSIHSFMCLSVLLLNLWMRYIRNEWTDFDACWHKWSTGQDWSKYQCEIFNFVLL